MKRIFFTLIVLALINSGVSQTINTVLIKNLCSSLKETSGLTSLNGSFYTLNDSGNSPEIYSLDTLTGCWNHKIVVRNEINHDWEALTKDENFIYIGDFGNNSGSRTNLRILKIPISTVLLADTVDAEIISFNYALQTDFTSHLNNTSYDCEAFVSIGDSLYLFSKNWINNLSEVYVLPKNPGVYSVIPFATIITTGKITDADYDGINLHLLGYTNIPFYTIYENCSAILDISTLTPIHYTINLVGSPQMEGIHVNNGIIYFTSEELIYQTYTFPSIIGRLKPQLLSLIDEQTEYFNYINEEQLYVKATKTIKKIEIYNMLGQTIYCAYPEINSFSCPLKIHSGIIVLTTDTGECIKKRF